MSAIPVILLTCTSLFGVLVVAWPIALACNKGAQHEKGHDPFVYGKWWR